MSIDFFEHFLRTEISRHPSLGAALQSKTNLRRCSQQFERAVAELHYRLIKAAVQLLFSRVSSVRLHELSSAASSSCETKYVITDSSLKESPNSQSSQQATESEAEASPWFDAQSNNSQGVRPTPRSPTRRRNSSQHKQHQQKQQQLGQSAGSRWTKAKDAQLQPECTHLQCQQAQCQQPQCQQQQQQQQQQHKSNWTAQPSPSPLPRKHRPPPQALPTQLQPTPPPQTQPPLMREPPSYSYPNVGQHNRQVMAGWYIANMDALLSNLMRLFELIYRDTLRICGVGHSDLQTLRNALPDPTMMAMQQRDSGPWRPTFMNCKIDFLLHIAAMVYRNTQDIRCGCKCSMPADPCEPQTCRVIIDSDGGCSSGGPRGDTNGCTANWNNAVAGCRCHRMDPSFSCHRRCRSRSRRRRRPPLPPPPASPSGRTSSSTRTKATTLTATTMTTTTMSADAAAAAAGRDNNSNTIRRQRRRLPLELAMPPRRPRSHSRRRLAAVVGRSHAFVVLSSDSDSAATSSSSSTFSAATKASETTGSTCFSVAIRVPL